jgi:hypothetical protein
LVVHGKVQSVEARELLDNGVANPLAVGFASGFAWSVD